MLEQYWYIAAESKTLRQEPLAVRLFDKPLVLFRNVTGVSALEDRCAHRNAPLSQGTLCKGLIQCPYHGWQYDGSGRLVNVPSLSSSDMPSITIPSLPCIEQQGYIWVCMEPNPMHKTPPHFPHLNEKGWGSYRMKTLFDAPVEQCLENFLDVPHASYVHKRWFRSPLGIKVRTVVRTLDDGALAQYHNEPRKKSLIGATVLGRKKASMSHTDRFIAPSASRVDYIFSDTRHIIITSFCCPINERQTQVYTVLTFKFWRINWLIKLIFGPVSRHIIQQDVNIMAAQQKNMHMFGTEKYVVCKSDLLLPHIKAWRSAIREGANPPPEGRVMEQEIIL